MRIIFSLLGLILLSQPLAAQDRNSEHVRKTLEIYTRIIGMETSKNLGNVPAMAEYLIPPQQELILVGNRGSGSRAPLTQSMISEVTQP